MSQPDRVQPTLETLEEKFTPAMERAVVIARLAAQENQAGFVLPIHLLIGLSQEGEAKRILGRFNFSPEKLRMRQRRMTIAQNSDWANIPFSVETAEIIDSSLDEAKHFNSYQIATEYTLLALWRAYSNDSGTNPYFGITYKEIRQLITDEPFYRGSDF